MKKNWRFIFLYLLFVMSLHSQETKWEGTIFLKTKNGEPVPAQTPAVIRESGLYLHADYEGKISYKVKNQGSYTLRIILNSEVVVRKIQVEYPGQNFIVNAFSTTSKQGEIEVTGKKDRTPSRYVLQQDEIKRLPGAFGDSLKAIQTLPGVSPGLPAGLSPSVFAQIGINNPPYRNSDRGDLVFRGAGTRNNQYYFDGFLVSYPFHLGNQSSVFNNSLIQSIEILTGPYSARYGHATGGIINIEGRDTVKKSGGTVNINLFLGDAFHQWKTSDSSYVIAAARKSYPNITMLRLYPEAIPTDAKYADYEDFQFKAGWEPFKNHKLQIASFGARDRQKYTKTQAEFENQNYGGTDRRPPVGLDRMFRTDGFRYSFQPGDRLKNTLSVSNNSFKEFYEVKFENPTTAETVFGLQNVTSQNILYAENVLSLQLFKDLLKIEAGGSYRERKISLKAENISQQSSDFSKVFNDMIENNPVFRALVDGDYISSKEYGGFLEASLKYQGFSLTPGVRSDHYNLPGQRAVSPRGTASYEFKSGTSIFGGGGDFHNAPTGIEQISRGVGNPNLKMEKAEHNVIGISQAIGTQWVIKAEGFRNIYSNLVVADSNIHNPYGHNDAPRDILQKSDWVFKNPIIDRPLYYSNSGTGWSEGVEIQIRKTKKPEETGVFGWLSYTNSITKRNNHQARYNSDEKINRSAMNKSRTLLGQTKLGPHYLNYYNDNKMELVYDNDKEEYYDLDRTHIFNFVFGWKITQNWQFGAKFKYATNVPYTPITDSQKVSQASTYGLNLYTPTYSQNYNSERLSSLHQFDFRIDRFHNYDWGFVNIYLEVINFYGKRNANTLQYDNTKPYTRESNPKPVYDTVYSPYIQSPLPGGRLIYLPLINFGVEVKF